MKDVRKGLLRLNRGAIKLQLAGLGRGNQVDRSSLVPRVIGGAQNFSLFVVRARHPPARQSNANDKKKMDFFQQALERQPQAKLNISRRADRRGYDPRGCASNRGIR